MIEHSRARSIPRTSRRGFLMSAASGVAVMTAASPAIAPDPAKPVRLGVVGTGSRGCDLIRKLVTIEPAQIVAICDDYAPHLEAGRAYAGEQAEAFGAYEAMLAQKDLDAVIIATPLSMHFPMCAAAIEQGLAVFCEKTMCYSIEEAQRLAELVKANDAIFQVGLQRRSNPIYEQAQAMVDTGMLGDITAITCHWHRNDDWRRDLTKDKADPRFGSLERRLNWRLYREYSQGLMAELGSHQVDVANRLLNTPPARVIGSGGIDHWRDGREVFDNVFCTYEYEITGADAGEARTVRVTFSAIQGNAHQGVMELVMGTKGTLLLTQKKALFYVEGHQPASGMGADGMSGATLQVANDPWAHRGKPMEIDSNDDDTRAELLSFIRDVQEGNRETCCDVRVGMENTASVLIANEAMRDGRAVPFPFS